MTGEQLTLDVQPLVAPSYRLGDSIQDRFDAFHAANPWVADALERMTVDLIGRGRHRVGMKMLVEVVRWEYTRATTTQGVDWRLNNNFTSRYARLLVQRHPEWDGVFETRELRAA